MTRGQPCVVVYCGGCGFTLKLVNIRVVPQPDGTTTTDVEDVPIRALTLHLRYACRWTPRWSKARTAALARATGAG